MIRNSFRWIASHQVISFFIITFLITWGLGFSYIAVMREKYLFLPLMFLATCGPAIAGIIVASVSDSDRQSARKRFSWLALLICWVVVTMVFVANQFFVNKGPVSPPLVILIAVSSLPVAFIVNIAYTRFPVLRGFKLKSAGSGTSLSWIIIAFVLFPVLTIISVLISRLMGHETPSLSGLPATGFGLAGLFAIKFLSQFFYFNGTGEEVGWRGFALPRLQAQTSPLVAGLILALFLGVFSGIIAFGLWKKPTWRWPNAFNPFKAYHWSWAGALAIAVIMWIWLAVEMIWVDYPSLQVACFIWGGINLLLALLPPVRRYLKTRA